MSEAWREVARLGKVGRRYPHVLADSRGWCLRWGPNRQTDDKYFSSITSLLQGLSGHFLRRRLGAGEDIRTLARIRELVELTLKEAAALGAALDTKLRDSHQGPLEASERRTTSPNPPPPPSARQIAAESSGKASQAA